MAAGRLAEFLRKADVTLRGTARQVGVSPSTMIAYERGMCRPSPNIRRAISRVTKGYVRVAHWEQFESEAAAAK